MGFPKFWTDELIKTAVDVMAGYRIDQLDEAAEEFNRRTGQNVTGQGMRFGVWRATGIAMSKVMLPRASKKKAGRKPTIEVDASEFDEVPPRDPIVQLNEGEPEWNATMPEGQVLKGNSTFLDGNGNVEHRWVKTEEGPVDEPLAPVPPNFALSGVSTLVTSKGVRLQWVSSEPEKARQWDEMWCACREATREYEGLKRPAALPGPVDRRLVNVFPIGDPHVGMYAWAKETGESFDTDVARDDLLAVFRTLVDRSPAAKAALIAQLGDFYHSEDDRNRTPINGNPLDSDGRTGRVTKIGYLLMESAIDLALERHDYVYVVNLRGNHDPYKAIGLNLWLEGVYRNEPRVTVLDNNNPFVFFEHGLNLWGFHHGDGAKPEQLPGIMSTWQEGAPWGRCRYRRWFTGHVHSFNGRDFPGCTWESFRTLAPSDYWSNWKGYRSEQSLDCLTFDEEDGLVSRQTVSLKLGRKSKP